MLLSKTVPTFKRQDHNLEDVEKRLSQTLTTDLYNLWVEYMSAIRRSRVEYEGYAINKRYLKGMHEAHPSNPQTMIDMQEGHDKALHRYEKAQNRIADAEDNIQNVIEEKTLTDEEVKYISDLRADVDKKDKEIAGRVNKHIKAIEKLLEEEYENVYSDMRYLHKLDRLNKNIHMYTGLKSEKPSVRIPNLQSETGKSVTALEETLKSVDGK